MAPGRDKWGQAGKGAAQTKAWRWHLTVSGGWQPLEAVPHNQTEGRAERRAVPTALPRPEEGPWGRWPCTCGQTMPTLRQSWGTRDVRQMGPCTLQMARKGGQQTCCRTQDKRHVKKTPTPTWVRQAAATEGTLLCAASARCDHAHKPGVTTPTSPQECGSTPLSAKGQGPSGVSASLLAPRVERNTTERRVWSSHCTVTARGAEYLEDRKTAQGQNDGVGPFVRPPADGRRLLLRKYWVQRTSHRTGSGCPAPARPCPRGACICPFTQLRRVLVKIH